MIKSMCIKFAINRPHSKVSNVLKRSTKYEGLLQGLPLFPLSDYHLYYHFYPSKEIGFLKQNSPFMFQNRN